MDATEENFSNHPSVQADSPARRCPILTQQGSLLKMKIPVIGIACKTPRGGVSSFSARSRKRMLETFARLDSDRMKAKTFVTLTYPDGDGPPVFDRSSLDLKNFLKRIKRRFPEASGLWRREREERKSGDHVGVVYPHFHILFFNLPFFDCDEVNRHWRDVLGHDGYARTEIKSVKDWRQAFGYVAKYMAKPLQPPQAAGSDPQSGERRGRFQPSTAADDVSLVYAPYWAADNEGLPEEKKEELPAVDAPALTGRHWGVFNRAALPLAERRTARIPFPLADLITLEASRLWSGIDPEQSLGFTLFSEEAAALFNRAMADFWEETPCPPA